jgi:hypothetical protein
LQISAKRLELIVGEGHGRRLGLRLRARFKFSRNEASSATRLASSACPVLVSK